MMLTVRYHLCPCRCNSCHELLSLSCNGREVACLGALCQAASCSHCVSAGLDPLVNIIHVYAAGRGPLKELMAAGPTMLPGKILMISQPASIAVMASDGVITPGSMGTL